MKRIALLAGLFFFLSSAIAWGQTVTPLTVRDGNNTPQTLCEYKPDGTDLAPCVVTYVWNGSAWALEKTGAGTAPGTVRYTVAQDSTTVAGSSSLPAGTNSIGGVTLANGSVVAGAYAQGAIPDIGSAVASPAQYTLLWYLEQLYNNISNPIPAGTNSIGKVTVNPAANFTQAQVSVTTSATQIVAARTGRISVTIENMGTTAIYLSQTTSDSSTTGYLLPGTVGATVTIPYSGAIYGITASGTQTVSEYEIY